MKCVKVPHNVTVYGSVRNGACKCSCCCSVLHPYFYLDILREGLA